MINVLQKAVPLRQVQVEPYKTFVFASTLEGQGLNEQGKEICSESNTIGIPMAVDKDKPFSDLLEELQAVKKSLDQIEDQLKAGVSVMFLDDVAQGLDSAKKTSPIIYSVINNNLKHFFERY